MKHLTTLAILCVSIFWATPSKAQDSKTLELGSRTVTIPAPEGYKDISEVHEGFFQEITALTVPSSNVGLAMFVTDEDYDALSQNGFPKLERYMMIQVQQKLVDKDISQKNFNDVTDIYETQIDKIRAEAKAKIEDHYKKAENRMKDIYDLDWQFKETDTIPLGKFHETASAFGSADVSKAVNTVEGEPEHYLIYSSTNFVLVRNRLLYVYVYGSQDLPPQDSEGEIEWLKQTSVDWTDAIVKTNASK
jgi:hypothetical protein